LPRRDETDPIKRELNVPLTVFQFLTLNEIIIVASPHELVSMIV